MLKPDAWDRGLADVIVKRLIDAGFVEEARCKVTLRRDEIERLFLHPLPDYVAHLESRPVTVHLLRGADGPERLYACKWEIRNEFGVTDRLRNLIHGADEGNEHHLFLDTFFPDLPTAHYCGAADLDLRFATGITLDAATATLAALDCRSSLREIIVTLNPAQFPLAPVARRPWRRLRVRIAMLIRPTDRPGTSFQVHSASHSWPADAASDRDWTMADVSALAADGHHITLANLPIPIEVVDRYAAELRYGTGTIDDALADYPLLGAMNAYRRSGVGSFAAYRPGLCLMAAELRCDLARVAGMGVTGGSAGLAPPGTFSVSGHCARALG